VRSLARPSAGYGSYRKGGREIPAEIPAGVSVTRQAGEDETETAGAASSAPPEVRPIYINVYL